MEQPTTDFWKLKAKHFGHKAIFDNVNNLLEAAEEYFEMASKRTWSKKVFVGKDGNEKTIDHSVPFTLSGLQLFIGVDHNTWVNYREQRRQDTQGFADPIARIEQIIYNQKFEGATIGAFSASIISSDLGLTAKKELQVNTNFQILSLDPLGDNVPLPTETDATLQRVPIKTIHDDMDLSK